MDETAEHMGISPQSAQNEKNAAMRKLRHSRNIKELRESYFDILASAGTGVGTHIFNTTWTSATERTAIKLISLDAHSSDLCAQ